MNWIGGARSRVKAKDAKKKQREYFDRRRFQNHNQVNRIDGSHEDDIPASVSTSAESNTNNKLSQDIVFLRTLMNQNHTKQSKRKSPKLIHVNFERPRPPGCGKYLLGQRHVAAPTQIELPESPEIKSSMNLFHFSPKSDTRFVKPHSDMTGNVYDIQEEKSIEVLKTPRMQIIPSEFRMESQTVPPTPTPVDTQLMTPYHSFHQTLREPAVRSEDDGTSDDYDGDSSSASNQTVEHDTTLITSRCSLPLAPSPSMPDLFEIVSNQEDDQIMSIAQTSFLWGHLKNAGTQTDALLTNNVQTQTK